MKRLYKEPSMKVHEAIIHDCLLQETSVLTDDEEHEDNARHAKQSFSSFTDSWETSQSISDEIHSK